FTNGQPTGTVSDFIKFVVSKDGQALVRKEGYVPLF
ncbi:MAG: phosphate ABC transporter substrate-binding protein, partial [Deltaproteobacteria bacterium]|nr:phosphate ABC transporter substrate-binding protein [Deltaproteobacteria bacterium]